MQIPALLYGEYAEVRKRCRRALRRIVREGQPFWSAFQAEVMLDTITHPGVIVVEGVLRGNGNDFHCYAPLYLVLNDGMIDALSPEAIEEIFASGLEEAWSFTCMLSRVVMYSWMRDTEHCRHYVRAALRHWDLLDAEGERYTWASNSGEQLWAIPVALHSAMVKLGVPSHLVQEPLPAGGLYSLLAQADRELAGDLVEFGRLQASLAQESTYCTPARPPQPVSEPPDSTFMSDEMSAALENDDPVAIRRLVG
ncbi:MAG: hypothetical protein JWO42_1521, partial [Chloroflexi bacterium]|nr:hypothetical protein [Chloroflexota bacterium]